MSLEPTTPAERYDWNQLYNYDPNRELIDDATMDYIRPVEAALYDFGMNMIREQDILKPWICGSWALVPYTVFIRLIKDVDRLESEHTRLKYCLDMVEAALKESKEKP